MDSYVKQRQYSLVVPDPDIDFSRRNPRKWISTLSLRVFEMECVSYYKDTDTRFLYLDLGLVRLTSSYYDSSISNFISYRVQELYRLPIGRLTRGNRTYE